MSDPSGQFDPSAPPPPGYGTPPPAYATPPAYGNSPAAYPQPAYGASGGRYVPPSLDEIWYKTGTNILLAIVTCGLWSLAWTYRTHDDLQKHNGDGLGGAIALVISLFAGIVIGFTIPMELEKAYTRNGWASPVKTTDGLYLLIPFAGPFIWYPKMQAALNAYWISQGSQPAPTS